ncbi:MAG: DNA polymerase III subunit chi [Alphaproteobacteria bacterium]
MSVAPCEVWFYHLERTGVDRALPQLLEKTLARGWRALVRTASPEGAGPLDEQLWTYADDSFLPHALEGDALSPRQPILLSEAVTPAANKAQALFLIDGAEAGNLSAFERCVLLFDGGDEAALNAARTRWAQFKADGHPVSYWKQSSDGAWGKQA